MQLRAVPGTSLKCVAAKHDDRRCTRDGEIRVDGGKVCRQHWTYGWRYFALDASVAVDPRVAERAAAVLGAP